MKKHLSKPIYIMAGLWAGYMSYSVWVLNNKFDFLAKVTLVHHRALQMLLHLGGVH